MKTAYLHISTWVDSYTVWYAEHYYGDLVFGKERVPVRGPLSQKEASKINKEEQQRMEGYGLEHVYLYKPGALSGKFFSREKLLKAAIKIFKKDSRSYDALLVGDNARCDPQEMIAGPSNIMTKANSLWRRFEELDGWNADKKHWPKLEKISADWEKLVGKYFERN